MTKQTETKQFLRHQEDFRDIPERYSLRARFINSSPFFYRSFVYYKVGKSHPAVCILHPAGCELYPTVFSHIQPDMIRATHNYLGTRIKDDNNIRPYIYYIWPDVSYVRPYLIISGQMYESHTYTPNDFLITLPIPMGTVT